MSLIKYAPICNKEDIAKLLISEDYTYDGEKYRTNLVSQHCQIEITVDERCLNYVVKITNTDRELRSGIAYRLDCFFERYGMLLHDLQQLLSMTSTDDLLNW